MERIRRNKSDVSNELVVADEEDGVNMIGKLTKRGLSFFQIIKEIRDSVSQRHGSGGDGPSSVFYVPNEDDEGDDDNIAAVVSGGSLFRMDSSSSLKAHHAYENIGTSSGSEFGGNNETLEDKRRHKSSTRNGSGRNKFGFGSVGNLGESCEPRDHHTTGSGDGTSHAPVGTGAKVKSARGSSRRQCSASDQNLNGGFKDNDEYEDEVDGAAGGNERRMVMGNESENENEFGPQSLFITSRNSRAGGGRNSRKEQSNHLDRRIIGERSTSSSKMGIISGQEINGETGDGTNNGGWQFDGNCAVNSSTSATDATTAANNRASYTSSTSRTSTTSSESFKEIFDRNLKRITTFKSSQANKMKNQSVDDICGSEADPENAPDTPTRNGILGRLRDSSRSGFGSRSSSKKRGSSKHDTVNTGGFEVSQTDSPLATQKSRNSLSDSVGARGNTDDANDQGLGVSAKLSTGHNHQPSCSSEEELTSINSCENRLSSLTLGGGGSDGWEGEYNGPFQGRAVATVDSEPSPYDRQALRYKKGDIIEIISMKRSGLWKGKVNNQIGSFKWMNVKLLPDPSSSSAENYDGDRNQRRVGGEEDEENDEDAEEDEVIDGDDSVGDYADTSNYQCSLHYNSHANAAAAIAGVGEECSCPPPPRGRRNDPQHHHQNPGARQYRGNSKRLAAALTPWDVDAVEQRQSVANVINGYGGIGSSNKDKRSKERGMYHGDPLGIMNADEDEDDGNEEGEDVENDEEIEDEDEEVSEEDESLEVGNGDGMPNRAQLTDKDVKCQKSKSAKNGATKKTGQEIDGRKHKSVVGKGQPRTVGDLLQRINLEKYTLELEKHGFESLDLLKELEEEDLDKIGITDEADRTKLLTAVELLREWDNESDRIPGPTYYQHRYYLTTQKTPKARPVAAGGGSQTLGVVNPNNKSSRITGQQQQGSPAQIQQQGHTTTNAGMPSPHFYRLHHPRDSGIFVGKVDGEEDGDEPISGADLSCAESHPDAETEEIILSPINLQKTSSVGVAGGGGAASGNPSAPWHSQNHHNNNNKQGSHHHINRFISKGAPAGIVPSSNNTSSSTNPTNSSAGSGPVQTAQQPTSSASSSGSSSSSSGITTTGDSFWNSVSSSNNSNGSSSASSGDGPGTSSIVVDQNHSQWTKQQQTRDHPASSNTHQHRKRDSSPAYNTDSVRNRFLQAKSLFEPSNNCSGGSGPASVAAATTTSAAVGGKPARAPGHVYENGGAVVVEGDGSGSGIMKSQTHQLHLQRGDSQGKSLSQQQNRFLYCEKSSDSGISVCTNSPPPLRNEFRN